MKLHNPFLGANLTWGVVVSLIVTTVTVMAVVICGLLVLLFNYTIWTIVVVVSASVARMLWYIFKGK